LSRDPYRRPMERPPQKRLQLRLGDQRSVDEYELRVFSRAPPVIRAWLAAPDRLSRTKLHLGFARDVGAHKPPLAISAPSRRRRREPLKPTVRERSYVPGTRRRRFQ